MKKTFPALIISAIAMFIWSNDLWAPSGYCSLKNKVLCETFSQEGVDKYEEMKSLVTEPQRDLEEQDCMKKAFDGLEFNFETLKLIDLPMTRIKGQVLDYNVSPQTYIFTFEFAGDKGIGIRVECLGNY